MAGRPWQAEQSLENGSGRSGTSSPKGNEEAVGGRPHTITVGDFTLVFGKSKKAQRQARCEMQKLQHLAASAESKLAAPDAADAAPGPGAVNVPDDAPMDDEKSALQTLSDEELENALKAICKYGLPGREDYFEEQSRRKHARIDAKPVWLKVKAVETK